MKIKILNKLNFNNLIDRLNINDENVTEQKDTFFISINDTFLDKKTKLKNNDNVLVLFFDDVEEDVVIHNFGGKPINIKSMSVEQAEEIVSFIEKHKEKQKCFIHCSAGISRSGAVGTFIVDYMGLDWFKFKIDNPHIHPNNYVLKTLKMVYEKRKNKDYEI